MAPSIIHSRLVNWACRSLIGNIVLLELGFGLPLMIAFGVMAYSADELTGSFAGLIVTMSALAGPLGGVMFWFGLVRPLLVRRGGLPDRKRDR